MAIEVPIPEVEISDTEQRISRIREYKERMNYTFKDIAEMSGVPVSTVKKVLTRATMRPRRQTVEKMMKALGIRESIHNAAEANGELYAQAVPGYISGTSAEKLEDLIPEVEAGIEEHLKNNGKSGDGNRRKRYTIEDYYRLRLLRYGGADKYPSIFDWTNSFSNTELYSKEQREMYPFYGSSRCSAGL